MNFGTFVGFIWMPAIRTTVPICCSAVFVPRRVRSLNQEASAIKHYRFAFLAPRRFIRFRQGIQIGWRRIDIVDPLAQ